MTYARALVDAGPLIAFYNRKDRYHAQISDYFKTCRYQLVTTDACIAEAMYALSAPKVQSSFSKDIAQGIWQREALEDSDFQRIAELFNRYSDLPADFADLSLVAISERLNIPEIVTLDRDFDIYRRFPKQPQPFQRIFYPHN